MKILKMGIKKVEGGKLIKAKLIEEEGVIKEVRITGDFFAHPEEAIEELENFLRNTSLMKVKENVKKFIEEKNVKLIGIKIEDIVEVIEESR